MKRLFTLALGLGAGATAAVLLSRWMRRKREAITLQNIGRNAAAAGRDLASLFGSALEEAKRGMAEREAEIRRGLPQ